MRQDSDKVAEIHNISIAALLILARPPGAGLSIPEEGVDDSITERVDGQLWDTEKVLSSQVSLLLLVQTGESAPEALDLIGSNC